MVQEINTLGAVFKSAFSKNLFGFDPGPRIPEATCLTAGDLEMLDIIIHHKLEIYYKIENSMSPVQSITTVCFVDQTGYRGLGIDLVPRQIGVPARPWIICMLLWCWRKLGVLMCGTAQRNERTPDSSRAVGGCKNWGGGGSGVLSKRPEPEREHRSWLRYCTLSVGTTPLSHVRQHLGSSESAGK